VGARIPVRNAFECTVLMRTLTVSPGQDLAGGLDPDEPSLIEFNLADREDSNQKAPACPVFP
jgi:hypothetical protein